MNSIIIDSTNCASDLCRMCAEAGTDKGPYTLNGHRHPYTAPYSLFLEPLRQKPIKFAEIGVFRGASILVWRSFFSRARIYGYDNDQTNLDYIASRGYPGVELARMDASRADSIQESLGKSVADGELFDVIIDDASHDPADQAMVIRTALPYLKQGGLLIIEDIFRERPEEPYVQALEEVKNMVGFKTFIVCEHYNRYSPGWNNDKMLIVVRS